MIARRDSAKFEINEPSGLEERVFGIMLPKSVADRLIWVGRQGKRIGSCVYNKTILRVCGAYQEFEADYRKGLREAGHSSAIEHIRNLKGGYKG